MRPVLFSLFLYGFEKLGVDLTPESIYMKKECKFKKLVKTCLICLISNYKNHTSEVHDQTCQNYSPSPQARSFLGTTKEKRSIQLCMVFTLFVNSIKIF